MADQPGFIGQIEAAKRDIRKLKKSTPYIFNEWQRLENAKRKFAEAECELKAARKAWKEF